MRAFMFLFFVVAAYAAPQGGYNYEVQLDPSLRNVFTQEQYKLLQEYAQQQINPQQPQLPLQILELPQTAALSKTVSQGVNNEAGGYHFANQLVQQAKLLNYEQEQLQQSQAQPPQQQTLQAPEQQEPIGNVKTTQSEVQIALQPQQFQTKQEEPQIETVVTPQQQPQAQPLPLPEIQQEHHEARHQAVVPQYTQRKRPQFNKQFYYLSAPQEDFVEPKELDDQLENIRKNIRVVFIRAPENNHLANAAVQLAKQTMDQQTVVYVLTKQHDAAELAKKLHQIRAGSHSKPDVVFIKYRTPQEAEQAQRTIQAQYEALDGPNHFIHEGVAPAHNFVGFTGTHHAGGVNVDSRKSSKAAEVVEAPSSKYLPSSAKL